LANLDIIEREGLVDRVREETGPHLANHFAALSDHPLVSGAEAFGMVAGLVLMKDKATHLAFDESLEVGMVCRDHCFANGLIMRAVGDRMIIAPPLVCDKSQIDELMDRVRICLDATLKDVQSRGWLD
jgi:putrescine aminotransferase